MASLGKRIINKVWFEYLNPSYVGPTSWSIGRNAFSEFVNQVPLDAVVVEFGSGFSSLLLAKKFAAVSVEHDPVWLHKYPTVSYVYAPLKNGFYDLSVLEKLPSAPQGIIIDGPSDKSLRYAVREGFTAVLPYLTQASVILVDDTNQPSANNLAQVLTRKGYWAKRIYDGPKDAVLLTK